MPHEMADDGAFHASVDTGLSGSLLRRPHSDGPWDAGRFNWEHIYRWSNASWDWMLGTHRPLDESVLAALQQQLAHGDHAE
jgi:hypothetical protein